MLKQVQHNRLTAARTLTSMMAALSTMGNKEQQQQQQQLTHLYNSFRLRIIIVYYTSVANQSINSFSISTFPSLIELPSVPLELIICSRANLIPAEEYSAPNNCF